MYQIRKREMSEQWEIYKKYGRRENLIAVVDTMEEAVKIKNWYCKFGPVV